MSQPSEQLQAYIQTVEQHDFHGEYTILVNATPELSHQIVCWVMELPQADLTPEILQASQETVDSMLKILEKLAIASLFDRCKPISRLHVYRMLRGHEARIRAMLAEMLQKEAIHLKDLAKELTYLNDHPYTDIPVEFHPEEHKWIDLLMSFCR